MGGFASDGLDVDFILWEQCSKTEVGFEGIEVDKIFIDKACRKFNFQTLEINVESPTAFDRSQKNS